MGKNKFKVGSSSYWIHTTNKKSNAGAKTLYTVYPDMMMVECVSKDSEGYYYSLVNSCDDTINKCYESDMFLTFKDALAEVSKRNSITDTG